MTIAEWLKRLSERLAHLPDGKAEARWLFLAASGFKPHELIARSAEMVSPDLATKLESWVERRAHHYPLAYLAEEKGFYKHTFLVREGVLIPRPETELVVEVALERAPQANRIVDLGCGSGCIGLSLLAECPQAILWAVDQSGISIETTGENAQRLQVAGRTNLILNSVEGFAPPEPVDLVVSNPPYIAESDARVEEGVRIYEPALALFSGVDGLMAIRAWSSWAFRHLRPGGWWIFEFGAGQKAAVEAILKSAGFVQAQVRQDLAGHARVISACKPGDFDHG